MARYGGNGGELFGCGKAQDAIWAPYVLEEERLHMH